MTAADLQIGANLKNYREGSGRTQTDLAADMTALGVPWFQQTVLKIERGRRRLLLSEAMVVSAVLRVSIYDLTRDVESVFA